MLNILITELPGVSKYQTHLLANECGIQTIEDLLLFFPRNYIYLTDVKNIIFIKESDNVIINGKIQFIKTKQSDKNQLNVTITDNTGYVTLVWFNNFENIKKILQVGKKIVAWGKVVIYNKRKYIFHPDIQDYCEKIQTILPVYPSNARIKKGYLTNSFFINIIKNTINVYDCYIQETLPENILLQQKLLDRRRAIRNIHFPENKNLLKEAKTRFKFEECFFFQCVIAKKKIQEKQKKKGVVFSKIGEIFNTFYYNFLPFELTNAQKRVLKEIRRDVAQPLQMNRLVQGDVGSGKTIVAVMAMLMALDNDYQAALMAPTEILAQQHYKKTVDLLGGMGIRVELLTGNTKKKDKNKILEELKTGHIQILIGTHALIEENVVFKNLGLTIIDEQHKFGVEQRSALWNKNELLPHNLVMSATPIPRSLALTLYGNLDISVIDELPPGRQEIKTVLKNDNDRTEIIQFLKKELEEGRQAYIVYPLIEESKKMDLQNAITGFEKIQKDIPEKNCGLLHGKMKQAEKNEVMAKFIKNEIQILVATTVIEVGIDVPNATLMIIENAERFGLSQLHQLRGRVGRGANKSYAILVSSSKATEDAKKRLGAMVKYADGFKIAEIDLQIRGHGNLLQTKQSGLSNFKFLNLAEDLEIINTTKQLAAEIVSSDTEFINNKNSRIKTFFEKNENMINLVLA